jgi:hypothetical protein
MWESGVVTDAVESVIGEHEVCRTIALKPAR